MSLPHLDKYQVDSNLLDVVHDINPGLIILDKEIEEKWKERLRGEL